MAASRPEDRHLIARIGGHSVQAKYGGDVIAARARAKSPNKVEYFERQVDPDGVLYPDERRRRAEQARKAHFARMALKSAQARRRKSNGEAA